MCVFIHSTLTFKLKSDLATNNNDMDNDMTMSLAKEIIKKKKNVVISAQYRQPVGDFKQCKTYLWNFLNKIKTSNKTIYLRNER